MPIRNVLGAFEIFRKETPAEIALGVDVHSLLDPQRAVQLPKDLVRFRLFYCEDLLGPEDQEYYERVRSQCSTPLAMGELWSNLHEWRPLIESRSIDYIGHHVSHIGGFTAARKVASLAESFGVKFMWHRGPNSPVGHMTNLTLDLTHENFGILDLETAPPRH
jgi:mannonate dehydratase